MRGLDAYSIFELPEYRRDVLEELRELLETGAVSIARPHGNLNVTNVVPRVNHDGVTKSRHRFPIELLYTVRRYYSDDKIASEFATH